MIKYIGFGGITKGAQCVVIGDRIDARKARDILLRTDRLLLFDGCSDAIGEAIRRHWAEAGYGKSDCLSLKYLANDYLCTDYIGGVHGWCHPDGTLHAFADLEGMPSWDDIRGECRAIARAFPFLRMDVFIFSKGINGNDIDGCDKICIGGYHIEEGRYRKLRVSEYLPCGSPYCFPWGWSTPENHEITLLDEKRCALGGDADGGIIADTLCGCFFSEAEFGRWING
jgi:hypothetical protein